MNNEISSENKLNKIINDINCEFNIKGKINKLPPELNNGNIEYKYKLTDEYDERKYQKLATQMNYRINEGVGKAIYIIGVSDKGVPRGIKNNDMIITLNKILKIIKIIDVKIKKVNIYIGTEGKILTIRLNKNLMKNNLSIL